jgi:hypothetical protein
VQTYRPTCPAFWSMSASSRSTAAGSASADTVRRSESGLRDTSIDALWQALAPFGGVIGELLASMPQQAD